MSRCLPGPHVPAHQAEGKISSKSQLGKHLPLEGAESLEFAITMQDIESSSTGTTSKFLGKELLWKTFFSFFFSLGQKVDVVLPWFLLNVSLGQQF